MHAAPQTITDIQFHNLTVAKEAEVTDLLPFKIGDPYDPAAVADALDILRRWGLFTAVDATTEQRNGSVVIHLTFTPAQLIGEINIHGNYPFVQNRIRRNLTVRPGDPFDPQALEAQTTRITEFYEREGYRNTRVTATSEWQPHTEDIRVDLRVKKGESFTLGHVTVRGNTVFPAGRFISALNPWRTYTTRRLRDALAKLTALYRRRHYPKARIRLVAEERNPRFNEIDVVLEVDEGPHVAVDYVGNTRIPDAALSRAITIFTEGRLDEFELETSATAIRQLYARRGYPDAIATFDRNVIHDKEIAVTFAITEGPWRPITQVRFIGNRAIGGNTLRGQMLTKAISLVDPGALDTKLLAEDAKALEIYYQSRGYLHARVDSPAVAPTPAGTGLAVTVPVDEGERFVVGEVRFHGNLHATHDALLKRLTLQPEHPTDLTALAADKEIVRLHYADHGYPYARVEQTVATDPTTKTTAIVYDITEGPLVQIGEILIVGDFLTSQRAIRSAMTINPGDPFSERRVLESQLGIRRLGAFRSVVIETLGLKEGAVTVPLKVRVEEEKPHVVDVEVGYSTDQHVTGTLNYSNINSFGWAKRTQFRLTGGRQFSRGEIGWIDPRFFGHDLQWTTNAWVQYENKPAFNYIQAGGGFGLYRQFHRTGFYARYNLERNYFVGGSTAAADAESLRDNTISDIGVGASFDTRNNFADPTKGIFISGGADFFNEIYGNGANFVRIHGGASHYWRLLKGLVLTQYGRLAGIQAFGNNISVPSNKLYFLGGDDTIRGFGEDSLGPVNAAGEGVGARVRWIYNVELAAALGGGLKFATFFDIGSLTNNFREITSATTRESFGIGLRYITPVGPLRADYGFKLDRRPGESAGRFHFTFGHVF